METITLIEQTQGLSDDDLRAMVGPDPHRPGPDRARLIEPGIPVWAIIGHFGAVSDGASASERNDPEAMEKVATDYRIPVAAVAAALLYYQEHRAAIDTRLAINAAGV